jgi:hypothetical protein
MEAAEYFERPLTESGAVRAGETEVWFKDFVHDVRPFLHISDGSSVKSSRENFLLG